MRSITAFLVSAIILATSSTGFGQTAVCYYHAKGEKVRRYAATTPAKNVTASEVKRQRASRVKDFATFREVQAKANPEGGAKVEWQMASELGNVGFQVNRVTETGKVAVDDGRIILGSAAKSLTEPIFGTEYSIVDPQGAPGDTYEVVALGQGGETVSSQQVQTQQTTDVIPEQQRAAGDDPSLIVTTQPKLKTGAREANVQTENIQTQQWVAAQPGAKIAVKQEGMYRVRLVNLQAAVPGLFTSGNTANWRLFRDGMEQKVIVGSDVQGTYLDFYGRGVDTAESDTHIYYLVVDPNTAGARVSGVKGGRIDSAPVATNYIATTSLKQRGSYVSNILNDRENWWGAIVGSSGANVPLNLSGVDQSAGNATLTISMQGWIPGTGLPTTQVKVNNTIVGTLTANTYVSPYSAQFTVPANILQNGANTIRLTAMNGGFELFDSYTLEYARNYQITSNSLAFSAPTQNAVVVPGFTSPNIRAFLVEPNDGLTQINRLTIQDAGSTYTVKIPSTAHPTNTKFFAVDENGLKTPALISSNTPSQLSTTAQNADMVIISHSAASFINAANTWRNYRQGQGINTVVVNIDDIMDEFNYGTMSAAAVTSFLQYVRNNWTPQVPNKQYVLLLGDASYDPRNYSGLPAGTSNLIPTVMVNTIEIETGSDDALADFDGDALPELAVGRIPARTADYITNIYNKTVAFEADPAMQNPERGVLFAYDRPRGWDFKYTSQELAAQLSPTVPKVYVNRGSEAPGSDPLSFDPNSTANLLNALNDQSTNGIYLVSYVGHGAQSAWSDSSNGAASGFFLHNTHIAQVTNPNPSIFMMLTCLNGYFINPGTTTNLDESIAEILMKNPNAGGPAAWASTGSTTADVQRLMGLRFMQHLGAGDIPRMGDLIRDAKSELAPGSDVRFSWAYFGDPMLKVR